MSNKHKTETKNLENERDNCSGQLRILAKQKLYNI